MVVLNCVSQMHFAFIFNFGSRTYECKTVFLLNITMAQKKGVSKEKKIKENYGPKLEWGGAQTQKNGYRYFLG